MRFLDVEFKTHNEENPDEDIFATKKNKELNQLNFWNFVFDLKSQLFILQILERQIISECEKCTWIEYINCEDCIKRLIDLCHSLVINIKLISFIKIEPELKMHLEKVVSLFTDIRTLNDIWGNMEFISYNGKKYIYRILISNNFSFIERKFSGIGILLKNCYYINEVLNLDNKSKLLIRSLKIYVLAIRASLLRSCENLSKNILNLIDDEIYYINESDKIGELEKTKFINFYTELRYNYSGNKIVFLNRRYNDIFRRFISSLYNE